MPQEPNRALRLLAPILLLAGVVGFGILIARGGGSKPSASPTSATSPQAVQAAKPDAEKSASGATPAPVPADQAAAPAAGPGANPAVPTISAAPVATAPAFRARVFPKAAPPPPLGSLAAPDAARVEISAYGAGIREFRLAQHFDTIHRKQGEEVVVQRELRTGLPGRESEAPQTPLAMIGLQVAAPGGAPQTVYLFSDLSGDVWRATGTPGELEAVVEDQTGAAVLRVVRAYTLPPGSLDLSLRQVVENLSPQPLEVRLLQTGPVDLKQDAASYGGDKRRVQLGYLLPAALDPTRAFVEADDFRLFHADALGKRENLRDAAGNWRTDASGAALMGFVEKPLWPSEKSRDKQYTLAFAAMNNRFFAASVSRAGTGGTDRSLAWVDVVSRVVLDGGAGHEQLALTLRGRPVTLAPMGQPGAAADHSLAFYAGPLSREVIDAQPQAKAHGIASMVYYNFGGPCAICTFQWLAHGLLALLHWLHDSVLRDWALAIITLVLIVRSLLHPVTRWSQIRMARWSKQMQAVAPKQRQIMDKFRDDPVRLRQEISRLNEEEGVSHAGALGCLPGFLQSPIWWALSALLYFAVELRHEAAFYGVFQKIQPAASPFFNFLGDLSEPDRLLYFGRTIVTLPMLGPIDSVNLLPVALGVLFFMQQKYMSPAQSPGSMSPEQEMQMKMTKWMMVILFPLIMYNAPSGLALYFLANSTIALLEGKWVRSHMDARGLLDIEKMKAERKARRAAAAAKGGGPGFFQRLQQRIEAAQQHAAQQQQRRPGPRR